MLSLLLFLAGLGQLTSADQRSETPLLQITVPRRADANTSDVSDPESHITYLINIQGKTYTLLLQKQSFLHPRFMVYSYSKLGTLHPDPSSVKGHCFYLGSAAEIPQSAVTLNTCRGLRGLLQLNDISYRIEPLESSATYEHVLYQSVNNKVGYSFLPENYPTTQNVNQAYKILVKSEKNSDITLVNRTMKIQVIMDKAMFDFMGSEVAGAAEKVVHIFALVNTMFSQLKMTVMLSSLELWSDQNKISTDGEADDVLQRFLLWTQKFALQRSRDLTYLLMYRDHPRYMGASYRGKACDPKFAAGIALYTKTMTLEAFSVVMTQILGISLGLTYKDSYNCYCLGPTCIMNPEALPSSGVKFFSNCSIEEFKKIVSQPEFECLQSAKVPKVAQQSAALCGNAILEPPEECDCGVEEGCTHKKCCYPNNCTLIGLADCGSGTCCDTKTCTIRKRGSVCRKSKDFCDFPEYCNGTSEFCAADVRSADLEPCNNRTAFCFEGLCRDPDRQCVELFGKFAKGPSYLCSQEVNYQGDKFGNCYGTNCDFNYIFCGKIVCHWTHSSVLPMTYYDYQYTYLGGHVCLSAHLRDYTRKDTTYVDNGTICGPEKTKVCPCI
ncbi:A disintegrin and metallopeptidase domain 3-like isoform X2 [Tupaia chinensis]|uniref:A disintegrin and metallopeptidase domain 3-like isoform X2 n=1 Tax=Tupaia chinensis TaxID=246437 RepID=UPI0003C8CF0C|nr:A disintegrin and metallopeptidase domain 3-like isoform X2 [Tupaia chinensis]